MTRKSVVLDLVQPESAGKAVLALSSVGTERVDIKHQEGNPVRIRPAAMPYHVNWRQCSDTPAPGFHTLFSLTASFPRAVQPIWYSIGA